MNNRLWFLLGILAVIMGCSPSSKSSIPDNAGDSSNVAADSTPADSPGSVPFMPIKALWLTQVEELELHEKADIHSAGVATLPRNTILIFGGERTGENTTIMTKGKSYTGSWLKVKSIDPEAVGWLFAGSHMGDELATEVTTEQLITAAEAAGRIIAPITVWSSHETAQSLEIKTLEAFDNGYSGFYQFLRNQEGVQTMDGRFWAGTWSSGEQGELKVAVYGEYSQGKPKGDFVATFTQGAKKETIWLEHDSQGKFTGRRYELEEDGKVKSKYTDLEESLSRESIIMD